MKYRCRNDNVLVRVVDKGKTPSGIATPNISAYGKEFRVISIGPEVIDLKVGDSVMMTGTLNADYFELPREKGLILIKQKDVVLVLEGEE